MGTDTLKINSHEFDILNNSWEGPKGAGWNVAFEFCRAQGLISRTTLENGITVYPSEIGKQLMKEYRKDNNE